MLNYSFEKRLKRFSPLCIGGIQFGYSGTMELSPSKIVISSSVSSISTDFKLSTNCSSFLAPIITLVTPCLCKSHANAICATEAFLLLAIFFSLSIILNPCSLFIGGNSKFFLLPSASL